MKVASTLLAGALALGGPRFSSLGQTLALPRSAWGSTQSTPRTPNYHQPSTEAPEAGVAQPMGQPGLGGASRSLRPRAQAPQPFTFPVAAQTPWSRNLHPTDPHKHWPTEPVSRKGWLQASRFGVDLLLG